MTAKNLIKLNFVAVGPQRTGTTWLYHNLQHHPELCFPKDVKETMFFDRYYEKGLNWYIKHFSHFKEGQICGEIAPTYFDIHTVPKRIQELSPDCKIIINLRNPIDRTFSLYLHHLSKGRVKGSFKDAIAQMPRIIESGKYGQHIPKWINTFGEEQVKFLLLEDIQSEPELVLADISDFIEINKIVKPAESKEKINAATMPRFPVLAKLTAYLVTELHARRLHHLVDLGKKLGLKKVYTGAEKEMPKLTLEEEKMLLDEYEEDITFVEKLVGRNLAAWRKQ